MAKKVPPSEEVSADGKLNWGGFSLKIRSRLISAWDRARANRVDQRNQSIAHDVEISRAKTGVQVRLIEALGDQAIKLLESDTTFARRAVEAHFGNMLSAQENLESVLIAAEEQLALAPPASEEPNAPNELSSDFLGRFDRHAREASTEELRQKWAGVLAAEVRKPGSISNKVMRIIDEIPSEVAAAFQKLCENALGNVLPKHLTGELDFNVIKRLVEYELIYDPGISGHNRLSIDGAFENQDIWILHFMHTALAVYKLLDKSQFNSNDRFLKIRNEKAEISIYLLTDVGYKISSIFQKNEKEIVNKLYDSIVLIHPNMKFIPLFVDDSGELKFAR